jgi:hypothetical protein
MKVTAPAELDWGAVDIIVISSEAFFIEIYSQVRDLAPRSCEIISIYEPPGFVG